MEFPAPVPAPILAYQWLLECCDSADLNAICDFLADDTTSWLPAFAFVRWADRLWLLLSSSAYPDFVPLLRSLTVLLVDRQLQALLILENASYLPEQDGARHFSLGLFAEFVSLLRGEPFSASDPRGSIARRPAIPYRCGEYLPFDRLFSADLDLGALVPVLLEHLRPRALMINYELAAEEIEPVSQLTMLRSLALGCVSPRKLQLLRSLTSLTSLSSLRILDRLDPLADTAEFMEVLVLLTSLREIDFYRLPRTPLDLYRLPHLRSLQAEWSPQLDSLLLPDHVALGVSMGHDRWLRVLGQGPLPRWFGHLSAFSCNWQFSGPIANIIRLLPVQLVKLALYKCAVVVLSELARLIHLQDLDLRAKTVVIDQAEVLPALRVLEISCNSPLPPTAVTDLLRSHSALTKLSLIPHDFASTLSCMPPLLRKAEVDGIASAERIFRRCSDLRELIIHVEAGEDYSGFTFLADPHASLCAVKFELDTAGPDTDSIWNALFQHCPRYTRFGVGDPDPAPRTWCALQANWKRKLATRKQLAQVLALFAFSRRPPVATHPTSLPLDIIKMILGYAYCYADIELEHDEVTSALDRMVHKAGAIPRSAKVK